jgi:hypothetical protein
VVPDGLWLEEMLPVIAEQLPDVSAPDLQDVLDSRLAEPRSRSAWVDIWEGLGRDRSTFPIE